MDLTHGVNHTQIAPSSKVQERRNYTTIACGVNNTTGIAVSEADKLSN